MILKFIINCLTKVAHRSIILWAVFGVFMQVEFSAEKNKELIEKRGISFEEIISAIQDGALLDTINHHNPDKYPNQRVYVVQMREYIYLVPFVRKDKNTLFLKTIYPSRKLTKHYLSEVKSGK